MSDKFAPETGSMNMKNVFCIPAVILLLLFSGCSRKTDTGTAPASASFEFRTMGTTMHITLYSPGMDKAILKKHADEAFAEVKRVENLMSLWNKDSEICRLNSSKTGEWTTLDKATFEIIEKAIRISKITEGAFDITVNPLVNLWGFGSKSKDEHKIPPDDKISDALEKVGYKKINLDGEKSAVSFAQDGVTIDLGGIAQGYGSDVAINALKKSGVSQAMVELGGEVRVLGRNKDGKKWRVGIRHPLKEDELLGVLELEDESVSTSGDYQSYFVVDGIRYSHIIDPKTGKPTTSGIASVTIVGKECADADALATGFMVLPFEKGCQLLESLPDYEGIIARRVGDDKLDIFVTEGLKGKVEISDGLK
jgi:FAD:protein FMN transferase